MHLLLNGAQNKNSSYYISRNKIIAFNDCYFLLQFRDIHHIYFSKLINIGIKLLMKKVFLFLLFCIFV